MSEMYKVTGYCNDETIYETKVTYLGGSETHHYGDSHLGEYEEFAISYPVEDRSVTFTATPKDGCSFVKWRYHIGSPTATMQTSTDNPFVYSEHKDIYIAAVGKKNDSGDSGDSGDIGGGDWSYDKASDIGAVTVHDSADRSFGTTAQSALVFPVTFTCDGIASIWIVSDTDRVKGYFGTNLGFDTNTGEPIRYDFNGDCDNYKQCFFYAKVIAGEQYYVWCRSEDGSAVTEAYLQVSIVLPKWSWDTSTGNATDAQLQKAYSAITKKLAVKNFSYMVWNDLCYRARQIILFAGASWNNEYESYANTEMSEEIEHLLTAGMFNSLRYNIGIYHSTGIDEVGTGDIVYGYYFTTLADAINGWIDTLL